MRECAGWSRVPLLIYGELCFFIYFQFLFIYLLFIFLSIYLFFVCLFCFVFVVFFYPNGRSILHPLGETVYSLCVKCYTHYREENVYIWRLVLCIFRRNDRHESKIQ